MIPAPPWVSRDLPPSRAAEIFGWTTATELVFLRWFLIEKYTGAGEVVELGTALGRSTVALADGLSASPAAAGRRLFAYDLFEFDWLLAHEYSKLPGNESLRIQAGDSFETIFRSNLGELVDRVEVIAGDIAEHPWRGGPIELLFIDIMKTWDATRAIIEGFFPALEPGLSVIVHQDYKHPYSPQILLTMYRLRSHFEPLWSVTGNGHSASVAFLCTRRLDVSTVRRAMGDGLCDLATYTIGEIESALDYALDVVAQDPPEEVAMLAAARTVLLAHLLYARRDLLETSASVPGVSEYVRDRTSPFWMSPEAPAHAARSALRGVDASRDETGRLLAEIASLRKIAAEAASARRLATAERDEARAMLRAIHESKAGRLAARVWSLRRRLRV